MNPTSIARQLCLPCGLCCNGVLFKDVELQPGDDARQLETLGLDLQRLKTKTRFPQPCAALCEDNRCQIYANRPVRCQQFECGLFQNVAKGDTTLEGALRVIQRTRQRVERVRRLFRELGDAEEQLPLSTRFRRTRRQLEASSVDEATGETFAELTLAVHELNFALGQFFYAAGEK